MSESAGIAVPPVVIESVDSQESVSVSPVVEDVSHLIDNVSTAQGANGEEGPILGSEAPVVIVAPILRVEQLKGNGNLLDSSFCTSEEEGFNTDDGDGDHSGNNSSVQDFGLNIETLIDLPPKDLQQKIVTLVEYYFSDESILKDAFLLKHVRRNRMGFVSIKLITSFKKMKALTKDYRVVAYSLKGSEKLELNEEFTKVRRKDPLPEYDETVPSRTVVAMNLPYENPTMENMAEIFSKCGCVANFRILKPGCSIPSDLHKFACKHPELGSTMCAVVSFETYEQAKTACEILTATEDWRQGMRVVPLMVSKKKEEKEKKRNEKEKKDKKKFGGDLQDEDISPEEIADDDKKRKKRAGRKKKTRVDELTNDSSCYSSGSEGDSPSSGSSQSRYRSGDHLSPHSISPRGNRSPGGSPRNKRRGLGKSPLADSSTGYSPRSSPEMQRRVIDSSGGDSTPSSPWVQRRLRAAQDKMSGGSPLGSPLLGRRNPDGTFVPGTCPRMLDMTNVTRQPRGPDATRGFYGGIGRGKPRSSTFT